MGRPKKDAGAAKKPRKPRAKQEPEQTTLAGHNSEGSSELTDIQRQDLFISCKNALADAKGKLAKVVANVRNIKKRIKSDGFTVKMVEAAILMETAEGEEKLRVETEQLLQSAKWVGVPWGTQLSLFQEPDRTPAVDKSREAGKLASMNDKSRKAPHAQESPQAFAWYAGYDEHQAELAKGFKKPRNGGGNVQPFPLPTQQAAE